MKLAVPNNHKILVAIKYKKRLFIQILSVEQIFNLPKIFKGNLSIYFVVKKFNKLYCSQFKLVANKIPIKTVRYKYPPFKNKYYLLDEFIPNKASINFDDLKNKQMKILNQKYNFKTLFYSALSLGLNPKLKGNKIIINNISVSRGFIKNFNEHITGYILYKKELPLDYIALEELLLTGVLTPLFLNKYFDITNIVKNNEVIVPYPLVTILYFLYGHKYTIKNYISCFSNGKLSNYIDKRKKIIAPRKDENRTYEYIDGYEIETRYGNPLFFVENIPIAYISKGIKNE